MKVTMNLIKKLLVGNTKVVCNSEGAIQRRINNLKVSFYQKLSVYLHNENFYMTILLFLYIFLMVSIGSLGLFAEFIIPFYPPSEYYLWYIAWAIVTGILMWKSNWAMDKLSKEDTKVYESDKYF